MNFLISLLEEHIRARRGSSAPETLISLDEQVKEQLEAGISLDGVGVAYLARMLLEVGLASTASVVIEYAARQAASVFEYSNLENLQGRITFESQDYDRALSHFNEAFQALASDDSSGNSTPDSASINLQYCIAFNIAITHKRDGDMERAKTWRRRLDELQHSLDVGAITIAAISPTLYWWDLALEDIEPTPETISWLRDNVTVIVNALGPDNRDSMFSLLTLASASCELALAQGNLDAAEDSAALMESMCQRDADSGYGGVLNEWMRLVTLSSYAEIAIARSRWGFLAEVAEQLGVLLRRWQSYRQDNATLLAILELNLAVIRIELARETMQPNTLIDTIQLLRIAIEDSGQSTSPLDPRASIAGTAHITSLVDALWEDPDLAIYGLAEKIEEAKTAAVACLGDEHPGAVILDRQLKALTARIAPGEADDVEASNVATRTRVEVGIVTGHFSRENYVTWGQAARSIEQEARSSRGGPPVASQASLTSNQGGWRIREVLRAKGTQVVTVPPDTKVRRLLEILAEHRIGAVVVSVDGISVGGIVSERDIVRGFAKRGAAVMSEPVTAIYTAEVHTITSDTPLDEVMHMMTERRVRHAPIVTDGVLSGIVSIGDIVKNRIDELETERAALKAYITGTR